jgi:hypothetical protein
MTMKKDPWTDPDPQPEDFAAWFAEAGPEDFEVQYVPAGTTEFVYIGNEDPEEWVKRNRAERQKAARNGANGSTAAAPNRR